MGESLVAHNFIVLIIIENSIANRLESRFAVKTSDVHGMSIIVLSLFVLILLLLLLLLLFCYDDARTIIIYERQTDTNAVTAVYQL